MVEHHHLYKYSKHIEIILAFTHLPVIGGFSLSISATDASNSLDLDSPPTPMDSRVSYFDLNSIVSVPYDLLGLVILVESAT